jgi:dTDP-4-dehydrorhamnose 3,5-epimerase
MKIVPTVLPEVFRIEPLVHGDERGFFLETWRQDVFLEAGIGLPFVQENISRSRQRTLRGLHFQVRHTQGKLVRAVAGEIFDVAVDVRRSSPTYGRWVGAVLSAENKVSLWIPPGFAHGFLVLSEQADFHYKCTDYYDPQAERSVRWNDPRIGIDWPGGPALEPLLSSRDAAAPALADAETLP